MTEEKNDALEFVKTYLAKLGEDEKFGAIVQVILPFLPQLLKMGKEAIEVFVKMLLDGNTDEAQGVVLETMTPEERLPILEAAMHKMNAAAIASGEMSEEALGVLLKVLLALLPLLL